MLPYPEIDPVIFSIGPLAIRWYGLMYVVGFIAAWVLAAKRAVKPWSVIEPKQVDDLIFYCMIGVIVGGRLGYSIFYGFGYWLDDPLYVFKITQGGMSFHGGLIGVIAAVILFCRRHNLQLLVIGDLIAAATPIGLFFGRIANFINGELWGKVTDVSWGVVFCNDVVLENNFGRCPAGTEPRHPSQIYEALLEGALLFLLLRIAMFRFGMHRRPGFLTAGFLVGYGVFRFAVEFFRDSESKIYAWFSVGQALSLPMLLAGALFAWYAYRASAAKTVK